MQFFSSQNLIWVAFVLALGPDAAGAVPVAHNRHVQHAAVGHSRHAAPHAHNAVAAHAHQNAAPKKVKACKYKPGSKIHKRMNNDDEEDCYDDYPEFDRSQIQPLRYEDGRTARDNRNRYTRTNGRPMMYTDSRHSRPFDDDVHRDLSLDYGREQQRENERLRDEGRPPWSGEAPPVLDMSARRVAPGRTELRVAQNQVAQRGGRPMRGAPRTHPEFTRTHREAGANRPRGPNRGLHAEEILANERLYGGAPNAWDESVSDSAVRIRPGEDVEPVKACDANCRKLHQHTGGRDINDGWGGVGAAGTHNRRPQYDDEEDYDQYGRPLY